MDKEYIEKQALIEAFEPERSVDWYTPWIVDKINEQPTADVVEVIHGCWLSVDEYGQKIGIDTEGYLNNWVFCSNCEQQMRFAGWLYCPNCGAKMDGKKVK